MALENFPNVTTLRQRLGSEAVNFVAPAHDENFSNGHWVLRDAAGESLVIEFIEGVMKLYTDKNDGGKTGFGVMTNSPPFRWQIEAMRVQQWKEGKFRPAVALDGSW